ncbi:MAG: hypothetical protein JWR50_276 [Mucilaginibacter sp.]|nr:hypothetical protein [Mucilaginibacter sp.]
MVISIADDEELYNSIFIKDLSKDWRSMNAYPKLQQLGSNWYLNKKSLVLQVPSAVIPNEHNFIINVNHPDFHKNVSLVRTEDYFWDERLF